MPAFPALSGRCDPVLAVQLGQSPQLIRLA